MIAREAMRKHGAVLAAVLLCAFHLSGFDVAKRPILTDVRFFLYFAWQVSEGAVPHLDYFENKTQLASFAGALLFRLGDAFGADPLMAIRWGYLSITALGGMAVFFIQRRLGGGRGVAGGLGLLAFCSFGLLGVLPATGNIPKLLMAVAASVAALLVYRRSWFRAGVVGALAFMDWQVGGLVGLAALVTAAVHGRPRLGAVLRVAGGGVTGLAPFLVYYLVNGAMGQAVRQVIGASLFRGSAAVTQQGLPDRLAKIARVTDLACPSQQWLFYIAWTGVLVTGWWVWRRRGDEVHRLLLPLAIYHVGVVAFSWIDFQYYGDFFLLLHSAAFFLGVAAVASWSWVESRWGTGRKTHVGAVALALAFVLARPGPLRPALDLVTPIAEPGAVLADQRAVAEALSSRTGDGTVAFLENSELLFLMRRKNSLPLVYWNLPAWSHYRRSADEPFLAAGARMLRSTDADVIVPPRMLGHGALLRSGYSIVPLASPTGRYSVRVAFRSTSGGTAREPTAHR